MLADGGDMLLADETLLGGAMLLDGDMPMELDESEPGLVAPLGLRNIVACSTGSISGSIVTAAGRRSENPPAGP